METLTYTRISSGNGPTFTTTFEVAQNADKSWKCTTTFSPLLAEDWVVSASGPDVASAVAATYSDAEHGFNIGINDIRNAVIRDLDKAGLQLTERLAHKDFANKIRVSTPSRSEIRDY